jgi:hypothetical protein
LSDLDPSSHGGFKVLFAREVPLEMRLQTSEAAPAEAGALEAVLCKVCVREGDGGRPSAVKVELSSEGDLFFHYSHVRGCACAPAATAGAGRRRSRARVGQRVGGGRRRVGARARGAPTARPPCLACLPCHWPQVVDERSFAAMREEQKLMVDFASYPSVLASSLANAIKEPHTFLAVFIMNREGQGRLDFIQKVSFRFIELLSVMFSRSPDDTIRQQIAFRYNSQKSRVAVMQARLHDIVNIVKVKNPSLLLQLQKPMAQTASGATPRRV